MYRVIVVAFIVILTNDLPVSLYLVLESYTNAEFFKGVALALLF